MFTPRANTRLCSPKQATQLLQSATPLLANTTPTTSTFIGLRLATSPSHTQDHHQTRTFSSTPAARLRDFFPAKETAHIRKTPPAWPHRGYDDAEMLAVVPGHRPPTTWGDKVAWALVRTSRWCMDKATGMSREQKTDRNRPTTAVVAEKPLSEAQWVSRIS